MCGNTSDITLVTTFWALVKVSMLWYVMETFHVDFCILSHVNYKYFKVVLFYKTLRLILGCHILYVSWLLKKKKLIIKSPGAPQAWDTIHIFLLAVSLFPPADIRKVLVRKFEKTKKITKLNHSAFLMKFFINSCWAFEKSKTKQHDIPLWSGQSVAF